MRYMVCEDFGSLKFIMSFGVNGVRGHNAAQRKGLDDLVL